MDPLAPLRRTKHAAFVARKRTGRGYRRAKFATATRLFRNTGRHPWTYRPERYADTFLRHDHADGEASQLPERVFALWTGTNPLTPARARNLRRLRDEIEVPVELVTPDNVADWVLPDHLLHPAFGQLSLIHRSDYLRGYLMHHHGGGYSDIKAPVGSWRSAFAAMATEPEVWVTSFRTTDANWIGKYPGRMGRDILIRYPMMFGKSSFLMRSHTPLTAEWMDEMHRRMDAASPLLAACSAAGIYGEGADYPFGWTDLLGRVLDPLTLKYHAHVRHDDRLLLDFTDYR